jgi:archaeosine synthase
MTTTEIKRRDGLARTGIFTLGNRSVRTPSVLDTGELFPNLLSMRMTNVPLAAGREFAALYHVQHGDQPVTIHPHLENPACSGDCVLVANWHTALENPRDYVTWLCALKEKTSPDTTWYAPAAALPSNLHILCYSGFDLFDFLAVDLKSDQGIFCITEGEFAQKTMGSEICACDGCKNGDLHKHNRLALQREISLVTRFIEMGQIREFVESRCRLNANHVAILRHLDNRYDIIEQYAPIARGSVMRVNSGESMNRAEIRRFAARVVNRYHPPDTDVAVLLPCSAKKPYSLSVSHRKFRIAIANRAHELVVTSPLGIVPRELETVYPAGHYDVPVTGYWDEEECTAIAGTIARYFEKNPYRRIIVHLEGGALKVVRMAAEICGVTPEFSCCEHPASPAALSALDNALAGERRIKDERLRGICSYQFGITIDTRGFSVRGRFPALFYSRDRLQYFSIDTITGMLRPTFEGWDLIPRGYRILIDDFVPEGDVLAPGVKGADPEIREGDEVLVIGARARATGRASMSGSEMLRSKRGVAVRVRNVKKV